MLNVHVLYNNYHCFFEENLAFNKQTYQYSGTYKQGNSSKAVDGNSNTDFKRGEPAGSCTMTLRVSQVVPPWWRVDLQQVEHVSEVYIVNRGSDCGCPGRFQNFQIRVGRLIDFLKLFSLTRHCCNPCHVYSPET